MSSLKIAILTAVVLQVLDGLLTFHGVSIWGPQCEGNPIIRYLISIYGNNSIFYIKFAAILYISLFIYINIKNKLLIKYLLVGIYIMNLIYFIVVSGWIYILYLQN